MANERRKLEELNLLDNFLFGTMVTHPDYGEPFARYLLKLVLNREVGKLKVVPQSVYYASDTELHGAILDAYLEEGDEGSDATVYDVEPENDSHAEAVKALPRRMRFYRAKMDGRGLKAGEDYGKLQNLVMIMITPFDPFGLGRMRYTVRNACLEEPKMPFDDGVMMVFLNSKGRQEDMPEKLTQFLKYAENSTWENAVTEDLRKLHEMVGMVKHDEEVEIRYMKFWEEKERIRREALEEGREEGRAVGETVSLLRIIQRKVSRGKTLAEIADELEDSEETIRPLYETVQKYGVDCAVEDIYEKMTGCGEA